MRCPESLSGARKGSGGRRGRRGIPALPAPEDPGPPPAALAGTSLDVLVQVAVLLGLCPDPPVVLVDEDAHLRHELHLPLVQVVRAHLRHRRPASAPPREPGGTRAVHCRLHRRGSILQTPPQGTGPASDPSPAPRGRAANCPRRGQGAPHCRRPMVRRPATYVTVARWCHSRSPGVSSHGSGVRNLPQAAARVLSVPSVHS
ncbi:TPA: hypothetical protein BOS_13049 [Bos taurus]|nr:TPA: hypothetical protein BOS_13049 [Bos taurus]